MTCGIHDMKEDVCNVQTGQNFWLSYWSEKTLEHQKQAALQPFPTKPFPTAFYMTVYFSFGLVTMCVQATRAVLLVISTLNASQVLPHLLILLPYWL